MLNDMQDKKGEGDSDELFTWRSSPPLFEHPRNIFLIVAKKKKKKYPFSLKSIMLNIQIVKILR